MRLLLPLLTSHKTRQTREDSDMRDRKREKGLVIMRDSKTRAINNHPRMTNAPSPALLITAWQSGQPRYDEKVA